jgi:hypothetical protein
VLALLAWWWARGADPARTARADREGSGEPAARAASAEAAAAEATPDAADAAPPPPSDLHEHTIRVVDEAGAAIAGAWVEVHERQEVAARAVTDGLGRATVPLTREDVLVVGASGFMRARVTSPLRRNVPEVVLRRGYDIAGIVVDGAGRGIGGAALRLEEPGLPARVGTSGPDGRFGFEDVCDEEMHLVARAEGHQAGGGTVTPGDPDIRIVLIRPVRVTGIVVFQDGSPASGAMVGGSRAAADGWFTLDRVVPGRLDLRASIEVADRRWTAKSVVEVAADGTHEPIRLVLEPLPRSWINVRVLERDGSPAVGALVGNPLFGEIFPRTNAEGRVVLALDVAPGTRTSVWVAETRTDGLFPGKAAAATGDRGDPEVLLRPRDPILVTVVARGPDGSPLPSGVRASIDTFGNRVVRRDPDAALVAIDSLAREISVRVEASGYVSQYVQARPTDGRLEVRLRGATGAIACRLASEAGGPVTGGFVRARVRGLGSSATGELEPDGTFRVLEVPAGHAVVTAGFDDDMPLVRMETDVRAGGVTDLGTLVLRSPLALSGRVTDASGRPVGGAYVYAMEGESETRAFSRTDGTFGILVSPWFDGFVLATKPGHGSVHRRAADAADLVLHQEGKVRLEVRLPPITSGSRGYSIAARDPATGFQWHRVEWERIEGTTYLVSGLPPGRVVLVVCTSPRDGETEVVVVAGQTVPAVIDVPE